MNTFRGAPRAQRTNIQVNLQWGSVNTMKSIKAIVAATLAAATFAACDRNPVEQSGDPHLTLSPDSVVVGVYQSSPLTATVRDAGGAIQHVSLQYVSRDPGVATVNASGAISAVAVGSTYVVATLPDRPDVRDSVRVRVHADSCTGARPDFGAGHRVRPGPVQVRRRCTPEPAEDGRIHEQWRGGQQHLLQQSGRRSGERNDVGPGHALRSAPRHGAHARPARQRESHGGHRAELRTVRCGRDCDRCAVESPRGTALSDVYRSGSGRADPGGQGPAARRGRIARASQRRR